MIHLVQYNHCLRYPTWILIALYTRATKELQLKSCCRIDENLFHVTGKRTWFLLTIQIWSSKVFPMVYSKACLKARQYIKMLRRRHNVQWYLTRSWRKKKAVLFHWSNSSVQFFRGPGGLSKVKSQTLFFFLDEPAAIRFNNPFNTL